MNLWCPCQVSSSPVKGLANPDCAVLIPSLFFDCVLWCCAWRGESAEVTAQSLLYLDNDTCCLGPLEDLFGSCSAADLYAREMVRLAFWRG